MSRSILVLGATGTTGSRVARALRERGVVPRLVSRARAGMDRFDWDDPDTWRPAVEGMQRLYLVAPTDGSDPAPIVASFLMEAVDAGVQRVVLLSSSGLEASSTGPGALPGLVRAAVPEWAVLRPSWFMTNIIGATPLATGLASGEVVTATGGGKVAFVDPDDIAAVAVHALIAEPSLNSDLVLTGPETHSYDELCGLVAAQVGRPIRHRSVSIEEYADHLVEVGMPAAYAPLLASLDGPISQGSEDRVTDTVGRLTGKAPRALHEFIRANVDGQAR